MKIFYTILLTIFTLSGCTKQIRETSIQNQQYGNTTEQTKISADKIDKYLTYEIRFKLENPSDCITVEIESVYLQKSFPVQKIPARTYFIVEKKLNLPLAGQRNREQFTQLGRNFNNDWEIYSPVKICSTANDPLSKLDLSEYRIRFTTFNEATSWYIITVICKSKVIFSDSISPSKKQ